MSHTDCHRILNKHNSLHGDSNSINLLKVDISMETSTFLNTRWEIGGENGNITCSDDTVRIYEESSDGRVDLNPRVARISSKLWI